MPAVRARRSRQRRAGTLARLAPFIAAALAVAVLVGAVAATIRILSFVNNVTSGLRLPWESDPQGSVAWKLKHKERVNLLVLGYGGFENDAPYLTDTIMAVTIDPKENRIVEASIPRDIWVTIAAWETGEQHYGYQDKVNAAFMVGTVDTGKWGRKLPQYSGRDGGGRLAEATVSKLTGLEFDGYAAVDFKAFREVVDAVGGVDVCLSSPLDDYQYPNYHNGYIRGGIHFKAGCQHLNGERALELARSRKAIQPEQQTDFGRARRQQQLISAIKKQALSANGVAKAPFLMSALESDFKTDLTLNDVKAVYDWGSRVPDSNIVHAAVTDQNLLDVDACGPSFLYTLCGEDPTFKMLHQYFGALLVDPNVLSEKAPVRIANASLNAYDLGDRLTNMLKPLGFKTGDPIRLPSQDPAVVYDFSGGKYPFTAEWMADYFGGTVKPGPASLAGTTNGLLVVAGHDFAVKWYGRTA